jgi:hypothetical protein
VILDVRKALTFKIIGSAHTLYLWGFVHIPEQTAIISLYSINQLLFITDRQCGYRATRADAWNKTIQAKFLFEREVMKLLSKM